MPTHEQYEKKDPWEKISRVFLFLRPTVIGIGRVRSFLRITRDISIRFMDMSATTIRATLTQIVVCVIYSTYGSILWSSSESSQAYARGLGTNSGRVNRNGNDGNDGINTGRRVRAFLSLDIRPTAAVCGRVLRILRTMRGISTKIMVMVTDTLRATLSQIVVRVPSFSSCLLTLGRISCFL